MPFTVPATANDPAYDRAILDAVAAGEHRWDMAEVRSEYKGHVAIFRMNADALRIDGVRWGMGAKLMQQVCDLTGCMLPTARLRDLHYMQRRATVLPRTASIIGVQPGDMHTDAMRKHSAAIDEALHALGYSGGIVGTTGKPWILTNELANNPGKACNYGWAVPGNATSWLGVHLARPASDPALPFGVIQDPGFAHGLDQSDYSETATVVYRMCEVDGKPMDLVKLLQDPYLAPLASHEGVLHYMRQPGVPVYACITNKGMGEAPLTDDMCPPPPPLPPIGGSPLVPIALAAAVGIAIAVTRR